MDNEQSVAHEIGATSVAPLSQFVLYFLWLGTVGFGGPIALAGYMQRDLVEQRGWIGADDYMEGLALAQIAPGPLAAQLAVYLGFVRAGFIGATLVGLAFILPSFVMVLVVAAAYVRYGGLPWMQALFYGIAPAVTAIIARSALKLIRVVVQRDRLLWVIFLVMAISTAVTEREIVWLFFAGGVVSVLAKTSVLRWDSFRSTNLPLALGMVSVPMVNTDSQIWQVLLFFAKAGLFVFGSGLAIVPFLHGGVVQQHHWLTERQFLDAVAVAMITPGPVVITVAFIGYLVAGLGGAVAAGAGVFVPVYLVVLLLGPHYKRFARNPQLHAFVQGVTAAAVGAITGAGVVIARRSVFDLATAAIALVTFLILLRWKVPEPFLIAAAGVAGLVLYRLR